MSEIVRDERGNFEGFEPRECGDHRTVGDYRAWCHDCGEWCYPASPCVRCERPQIVALLDDMAEALKTAQESADDVLDRYRAYKNG